MRELRLVLLGLAALIALALGAGFLLRALTLGPHASREEAAPTPSLAPAAPPLVSGAQVDAKTKAARTAVERAIADTPDYTRVFDRMRLLFPSDYDAILSRLADARAGGDLNVDRILLDAMSELRHTHGAQIAKASDDALSHYFAVKAKEVQALGERDPHLCVVYASGGQASGFLAFWADHRPLVADEAIASLDAMNSGRMEQVKRTIPSDDDLQALDRALVDAGLTRPEISTLLDDQQMTPPISDERLCKAEQIYMSTVSTMPVASRSRLYGLWADLMAKS